MHRIVVIAAGMPGVLCATRLKRRLPASEVNLIIPAPVSAGSAAAKQDETGPVRARFAAEVPNLELLATRRVGIIEAHDIMPDLDEREITAGSDRGKVTIRYSDLVLEAPATARIPRVLRNTANVFPWPTSPFAAEPEKLDSALASATAKDGTVLVVGGGMAALDAVFLAYEAGAPVHWLHCGECDCASLDLHLLTLTMRHLGDRVQYTFLPGVTPEMLTPVFSDAASGSLPALAGLTLPEGECIQGALCIWASPRMAIHPILREEGVVLDASGRITVEGDTAQHLYVIGNGAACPQTRLHASGAVMPVWPGGLEDSMLTMAHAVDAIEGVSHHNYGHYAVQSASTDGARFLRAGLGESEAEQQKIAAEHSTVALPCSQGQLVLNLTCDKQSRTIIGAQVLGLGLSEDAVLLAEALFAAALAALAEETRIDALVRREYTGTTGRTLAEAASILISKLDTVIKGISPEEFLASRYAGAEFFTLDLRSLPDWEQGHMPGSYNIPLTQLKKRVQDEVPRFIPLVLISSDSRDAYAAATMLAELGATDLYVLDGGTDLWPYPVDKA